MVRYQLRSEDCRENPRAPRRLRWHVARVGAVFALCTRLLEPATRVRPIEEAESVPEAQRCTGCWARAFEDVVLPA